MKVESLQVRMVRGARRVDIHTPSSVLVEIAGNNGAGKSSVLDAFLWALVGKKALPVDVLHHGATKGSVRVDLGGLVIERKVTEKNVARGGTVKITAADGGKVGQRDLDALWSKLAIDPLAFAGLGAEQQVQQIRALAGEEFCTRLAELEDAIATARDERTEASREVKRFGRIPDVEPVEPVDAAAVLAELERAQQHNAEQDRRQMIVETHDRALATVGAEIAELEARLHHLRLKRDTMLEEELPVVKPWIEVKPLQQKLAEASKVNEQAAAYQRAEEERAKLDAAIRNHEKLNTKVSDLEEERSQHLRTVELPVEGLSWEGGHITLGGTPFGGLSTTEQLLLSARIGMAMSPDLRVMMIREGGLIDDTRFAALRDLAEQEGCQLWVETAGNGHSRDALVIEDGELDDSETQRSEESDDWDEG